MQSPIFDECEKSGLMNKALLVRIFTPVLDPKNQEKPGQLGECGTGYPVGPDLVLTAWHVVFPDDRDPNFPIEVRWHSHPNVTPADGWFVLKDEDIVWEDKQLDAALLRCPRPEAMRGFGYVSDQRPRTGHPWESAGFPRVARYEKVQHAEPFRGEMNSLIEGEGHFTIDVTAPPRNDEDWRGASGMPVFRQGTSIILGLVKQVPQGFGGGKLHVIPSFRLLESPTFRQAIGHDVRERRRGQVEADLASLLASSGGAAIKSILEHTQLCCDLPPELS